MEEKARLKNGKLRRVFIVLPHTTDKTFVLAIAALSGTIVGAGVFAIPFVFSKSGIIPAIFYFAVLGVAVTVLHLFFAEIVLRTKEKHCLAGYAAKYFGKKAKAIVAFITILGSSGSLLVYTILQGDFSHLVFPQFSAFQWSLFWWLALSLCLLLGIKVIASIELWMNLFLIAVVLAIFAYAIPQVKATNFIIFNKGNLFLPFGIFLYSLVATSAIPEVALILKKKRDLKKVIITSSLIVIPFYFLFGLLVVGVTGLNTTNEAFQGLRAILGERIMVLAGIFGFLSVASNFLILGDYLKNTFSDDLKLSSFKSLALTVGSPLSLFLVGFRDFIGLIGFLGIFIGLVETIAIVLIFRRARKNGEVKPPFALKYVRLWVYFIIITMLLGALFQLIYG